MRRFGSWTAPRSVIPPPSRARTRSATWNTSRALRPRLRSDLRTTTASVRWACVERTFSRGATTRPGSWTLSVPVAPSSTVWAGRRTAIRCWWRLQRRIPSFEMRSPWTGASAGWIGPVERAAFSDCSCSSSVEQPRHGHDLEDWRVGEFGDFVVDSRHQSALVSTTDTMARHTAPDLLPGTLDLLILRTLQTASL